MIIYRPSAYSELSLLKNHDGIIYHQKGLYSLHCDEIQLFPVNRSYSPDIYGDRMDCFSKKSYHKDSLIHENVSYGSTLKGAELILNIYNTPLLFLKNNNIKAYYNTRSRDLEHLSLPSQDLVEKIEHNLGIMGFSGNFILGLYGSHRISLHGVDSDSDLIAWTAWDIRKEFLKAINEAFKNIGFVSTRDNGKDIDYATHYARRNNTTLDVGHYLANRRNRWISPGGVSVSLQCLNIKYDHTPAKSFFEYSHEQWEAEEISSECRIVFSEGSYNFPKTWVIEITGHQASVISCSWAHQGMADDADQSKIYILKAMLIRNADTSYYHLQNNTHYLLPKELL